MGLACLSDVCVDPGPLTTSAGDTTAEADDTGSDGGWMPCTGNVECGEWEICNVDGICDAARKYPFLVYVTRFAPPDCSDGWGTAEVVFEAYVDEALELRSSEALCPAEWPVDSFPVGGSAALRLSFLEADGFSDDPLTDLCWQDEAGNCTPIPPEILHAEGFDGLTADGQYELSLVIIRA